MKRTIKVTRYIVEEVTMIVDLTDKELKAMSKHDLDQLVCDLQDDRDITQTIERVDVQVEKFVEELV